MKRNTIFALIISLLLTLNCAMVSISPVFAHEAILSVDYDECNGVLNRDGIDETWYILEDENRTYHLSDTVSTIKYYFAEKHYETGCTWIPEGQSSTVGEEIKAAYANSMKKWNNVYFYSYNNDGTITKNKIINVVAGTATDHNLTIYPSTGNNGAIALTGTWLYPEYLIPDPADSDHYHCPYWIMEVNIDYFYENNSITEGVVDFVRERNGAHELGHMLGLLDVDYEQICDSTLIADHHQELLMGYGNVLLDRSANITYKDIAGVAITRGFHTDEDHKWLNMGQQNDGTYKLVCSICNGVKYVESLNEYSCEPYGICENQHTLASDNMMAVASYSSSDYYKCKYCRYVATFDNRVSQNYKRCYYSEEYHVCVNEVNGLKYVFYEPHTFVNGECINCEPHIYDICVYVDLLSHRYYCACGAVGSAEQHYIIGSVPDGTKTAPCEGCGHLMPVLNGDHVGIMSITQVSVNGSYILPNGIVVLVEEDVEAYLAGTLQFYHPEDVPVTQ